MTKHRLFRHDAFPVGGAPAQAGALRLLPGTRVLTPDGAKAAEALGPGDLLVARSGAIPVGACKTTRMVRADWAFAPATWPVRVPVGSLGNGAPLRLAADQVVVLVGETVREICHRPEIEGRVSDLIGLRGIIVERPLAELRLYEIALAAGEVVCVEGADCVTSPRAADMPARDDLRRVFQAMHGANEPRVRVI